MNKIEYIKDLEIEELQALYKDPFYANMNFQSENKNWQDLFNEYHQNKRDLSFDYIKNIGHTVQEYQKIIKMMKKYPSFLNNMIDSQWTPSYIFLKNLSKFYNMANDEYKEKIIEKLKDTPLDKYSYFEYVHGQYSKYFSYLFEIFMKKEGKNIHKIQKKFEKLMPQSIHQAYCKILLQKLCDKHGVGVPINHKQNIVSETKYQKLDVYHITFDVDILLNIIIHDRKDIDESNYIPKIFKTMEHIKNFLSHYLEEHQTNIDMNTNYGDDKKITLTISIENQHEGFEKRFDFFKNHVNEFFTQLIQEDDAEKIKDLIIEKKYLYDAQIIEESIDLNTNKISKNMKKI